MQNFISPQQTACMHAIVDCKHFLPRTSRCDEKKRVLLFLQMFNVFRPFQSTAEMPHSDRTFVFLITNGQITSKQRTDNYEVVLETP